MFEELHTLDVDRFEALRAFQQEGQPSVLGQMAGMFVEEVHGWLNETNEAVRIGDAAALKRLAHALKGVCGTIGADRMRAMAVEIERLLMNGPANDAREVGEAMNEEFSRLTGVLRSYSTD